MLHVEVPADEVGVCLSSEEGAYDVVGAFDFAHEDKSLE